MAAKLTAYGAGYLAHCAAGEWAAIRPGPRPDTYESSASGGGRIVHGSPQVVADDDRVAVFSSRSAAIASLTEHGVEPAAAHRPRRDPSAARVNLVVRVHPDTRARLAAEARRTGESQGQVVDRLAHDLAP